MEQRTLLTVYTVTSTSDVTDPLDGQMTLREAIVAANQNADADEIRFNIPGAGAHTISPTSPLPTVRHTTVIDATIESGYINRPVIFLDGTNAGTDNAAKGLRLQGDNSVVRGLAIGNFFAQGILIDGSVGATISQNFIGTDVTGTVAQPNGYGILVYGSSMNSIEHNLLSGNTNDGIRITETTSSQNIVRNNRIGTDDAQTVALGNLRNGVTIINGATNNTVENNTISGNQSLGVSIHGSGSTGNVVRGSRIGTNASGMTEIPNGTHRVWIGGGATDNQIGQPGVSFSNVIGGNRKVCIFLTNENTSRNTVMNNLIGVNVSQQPLPNEEFGVTLYLGPSDNQIGGNAAGNEGNVISGNLFDGVRLEGATTASNVVQGNSIGTNSSGQSAVSNE
ncbi:MAG: right-handed parallel beta-helix repeat-containing protein [Planctomycetaceae bacterium]